MVETAGATEINNKKEKEIDPVKKGKVFKFPEKSERIMIIKKVDEVFSDDKFRDYVKSNKDRIAKYKEELVEKIDIISEDTSTIDFARAIFEYLKEEKPRATTVIGIFEKIINAEKDSDSPENNSLELNNELEEGLKEEFENFFFKSEIRKDELGDEAGKIKETSKLEDLRVDVNSKLTVINKEFVDFLEAHNEEVKFNKKLRNLIFDFIDRGDELSEAYFNKAGSKKLSSKKKKEIAEKLKSLRAEIDKILDSEWKRALVAFKAKETVDEAKSKKEEDDDRESISKEIIPKEIEKEFFLYETWIPGKQEGHDFFRVVEYKKEKNGKEFFTVEFGDIDGIEFKMREEKKFNRKALEKKIKEGDYRVADASNKKTKEFKAEDENSNKESGEAGAKIEVSSNEEGGDYDFATEPEKKVDSDVVLSLDDEEILGEVSENREKFNTEQMEAIDGIYVEIAKRNLEYLNSEKFEKGVIELGYEAEDVETLKKAEIKRFWNKKIGERIEEGEEIPKNNIKDAVEIIKEKIKNLSE